jgi:hypothetical protein
MEDPLGTEIIPRPTPEQLAQLLGCPLVGEVETVADAVGPHPVLGACLLW